MIARILRHFAHPSAPVRPTRQRRSPRLSPVEALEPRTLLAAEIAVFDGAIEIPDDSTNAIDIGNAVQGLASPIRDFTIQNDGDERLTIEAINLPDGFRLVEAPLPNVSAGSATQFRIQVDSTTAGVRTGDVTFRNSDDDENPYSFAITATVVAPAPEISVFDGNSMINDGSIVPIDFGSVRQRSFGPVRTFTIRNDGTAPLPIGSIALPLGYFLSESPLSVVDVGRSATFSVQLSTASTGERAGQVSFTTGDADESPFNFAIMGTVTSAAAPEISVFDGFTNVPDGSTTAIDFGTVFQSQPGLTRAFRVRNEGTDTLRISAVAVPAGFTLVSGLPSSLIPGSDDSFSVRLDSATAGMPTGQVQILTNDTNESLFNFTVSGTVLASAPEIRVFREDLLEFVDAVTAPTVFPTIIEDLTTSIVTFAVSNVGAGTLTIAPPVLPAGFSIFEPLNATLGPGEFDTFTIQLDNTTPGLKQGDMEITTNDGDESPFSVRIAGTVLANAPEISVFLDTTAVLDGSAAAVPLGLPIQGQRPPSVSFTIRNDGATPLLLGTVTLPAGLTLFRQAPTIIAPGQSDGLAVQIDTRFSGTYSGEISFVTNDSDESPFNFPITVTVTSAPLPEIVIMDGTTELVSGSLTAIDFGTVLRRQTAPTRTFTIRNAGTTTLSIRQIDLPAGFSVLRGRPRRIAAGASDTITIRLETKRVGIKTGRFVINNDDRDEAAFQLFVTGAVVTV